MSIYGIVVMSKDGYVILDEKSMVQSWGNTMVDNIDENNPAVLKFKYPNNTEDVVKLILSITYDLYRTYSGAEEETGLQTTTGGNHSHSISTNIGSADQDMSMDFGTQQSESSQGHTHTLETVIVDSNCTALRDHEHHRDTSFSSGPEGDHKHTIQDHSHDLDFGMETMGLGSLTVDIEVNGSTFMTDVGPEDSVNLEIPKEMLNYPGWNIIEIFSSEGLSRVNANYFTQIYLGT